MASRQEQGLSKRTLAELREFHTTPAAQEGGSEAQAHKLRRAIEASPQLLREVNRAIGGGEVQGFRVESNAANNGSYSPKDRMIRISPRLLDPLDIRQESELIFVSAHEICPLWDYCFRQSAKQQAA